MRELNELEVAQIDGGAVTTGDAIGMAGVWVGTVAGVGLGLVGAPVLAAGAVTFALGTALVVAVHLVSE